VVLAAGMLAFPCKLNTFRKGLGKILQVERPSAGRKSARNNRGTAGNWGFYGGPCPGIIRWTNGARIRSWKGSAIQRRLEPGNRGIAIVRSRYQAATNEDTAGWKGLSLCSSDL
jgi:hypothetical protein